MSLIVVTSPEPGAGKTGVAAALGRRLAYMGEPVRLVRAAPSAEGSFAPNDAAYFASLPFAPGSSATTQAPGAIESPEGGTAIVEADAEAAASLDASTLILVTRYGGETAVPEGLSPAAVILTAVPPGGALPEAPEGVPLFAIPEDRTLAGFSVSEVIDLLQAEVLNEGDLGDLTCDYLVVAPMGSDSGMPYFDRFHDMAVVARFDRTDMHLAAIRSQPNCLILTGGRYPSDYVYDAVRATGIPLLLSWTDTENTVIALEDVWDRTRFQGERKLDRMDELLAAVGFYDAAMTPAAS